MPFRLDDHRAKIQFVTSAQTPALVYRACLATGMSSNTEYIQHAVAERLSKDLDIPLQDLLDRLPPAQGKARVLFGPDRRTARPPGRTIQEVR